MTRYILTILLMGTMLCCNQRREVVNTDKMKMVPSDIEGKWYLNTWTMYHTLVFKDNTVFADNHIDTVFIWGYEIKKDILITNTRNLYFKNKIILLTKDSLILDGIGDLKERRSYSRVDTHFK